MGHSQQLQEHELNDQVWTPYATEDKTFPTNNCLLLPREILDWCAEKSLCITHRIEIPSISI
jgi:hypothetical protein